LSARRVASEISSCANVTDANVISPLIGDTVERGDTLLMRGTNAATFRDLSFIGVPSIYTARIPIHTAQRRHGSRTFDIGVERVVATTISARLRDDGIRPVIYPTHSDPQSRARARATPGVSLLPASHPRAPSLSSSFPCTVTCSTLDVAADVTVMLFTYGLSAERSSRARLSDHQPGSSN